MKNNEKNIRGLNAKLLSLLDEDWAKEIKKELKENIEDVIIFLGLIPVGFNLPKLTYSDDGEVYLSWENNNLGAEISFSREFGHAYAVMRDGVYFPGKYDFRPDKFPEDLYSYLSKEGL